MAIYQDQKGRTGAAKYDPIVLFKENAKADYRLQVCTIRIESANCDWEPDMENDVQEDIVREKLNNEWMTICALREVINTASRGKNGGKHSPTYRRALALAEEMMPEHFAPDKRTLEGAPETINARLYRQHANTETQLTGQYISAYEYAKREYEELSRKVEAGEDADMVINLLQQQLDQLRITMNELKPKMYSEHKAIFGDILLAERNLPVSGVGRDYKQYRLDGNRALRIRVLHPDPSEHKTGADLFYEHLDEGTKRARLAIVQFKLWDGESFHQEQRMMKQIARMERFSCNNRLCELAHDMRRLYRLPPCAAFLRPTDRLQDPDSRMASSGKHIRVTHLTVWAT